MCIDIFIFPQKTEYAVEVPQQGTSVYFCGEIRKISRESSCAMATHSSSLGQCGHFCFVLFNS